MSAMANFPLRLPAELKDAAAKQADASGVSMNQFIATALAARVGATAEAERYFAARARRAVKGQARDILKRAGKGNPPRKGDELS
ncbi:YlcI/YnfO family protein [Ottowia sp.]|uniref:YlcI/YnfO family protein n=1 Tax=Ottowia sp. TaxID=1898956 RepID=UPI0039E4CDCF